MTRATELEKLNVDSGILAVLKPRRKMLSSEFSLISTGIYRASFSLGTIVAFGRADPTTTPLPSLTSFTEVLTSSVAAGEFYYDFLNELLYIGIFASNLSSNFLVCTYEIYVSTV